MTHYVVQWGGGITSWALGQRAKERHGTENVTLLFADTLAEDADLYRFNAEAAPLIGIPLTVVCDGRTPQEVNRDKKWISNAELALCSHHLKQIPCRKWLADNTDPTDTVIYVGLDWTEPERVDGVRAGWAPWPVEFPLMDPPLRTKPDLVREIRALGVREPRLYRQGFPHNNCGGACVRGGQAQWARVLEINPALFASWEQHEDEMREVVGDRAMLRDRRGGITKPLPLNALRKRIEDSARAQPMLDLPFDPNDWGGCGCFTEPMLVGDP